MGLRGEDVTNETYCAMQRRAEDRRHLLNRLDHLGYIPDGDMQDWVEDLIEELKRRMEVDKAAMTVAEAEGLEDDY